MFRSATIKVKRPVLQTPETFAAGDFKAGFWSRYTPLVGVSVLNIGVTTFDLATNWLVCQHVQSLKIPSRVKEISRDSEAGYNFYKHLPKLYLSFCILATVVYLLDVLRVGFRIYAKRRSFFEQRDGVSWRGPCCGAGMSRWTSDISVLLLTLLHDLPLSLLLLALQALVSCHFLFSTKHIVFHTAAIAALLSALWKLGQLVWNSGCCGRREEYERGTGLTVLRVLTALPVMAVLVVTSLNMLLLRPLPSIINGHTPLLDKLAIDRWMDKEWIVLRIYPEGPVQVGRHDASRPPRPEDTMHVVSIQELVHAQEQTIVLTKSCTMSDMDMGLFLPQDEMDRMSVDRVMHCSIVFSFYFDTKHHTIYTDYGYRISSNELECYSGLFMPSAVVPFPPDRQSLETSSEEELNLEVSTSGAIAPRGDLIDGTDTETQDIGDQPIEPTPLPQRPPPPRSVPPPPVMTHRLVLLSDMYESEEIGSMPQPPCKFRIHEASLRQHDHCISVQ